MIVVVQRHGTRLECGSSTIQLLRGWIPLDFKGAFEKARHGRRCCCRDDGNTRSSARHGGQGAAYARGLFFNGVHAGLNYKF